MTRPDPAACLDCGMTDPPPEQTCNHGMDHRVGRDRGCPGCGRLTEACLLRPCSVWRSVESALEDGSEGSGG
jgi:hypothetical protein